MKIIILHNPNSEASRALVAEMGVDPLTDAEAIQTPSGWTVTGRESYATLVCPAFAAYPTCVVIQDDGRMCVRSPVANLAECEAFMENPGAPVGGMSLDETKAVAVAQVKAASSSLADYLWPRLKAEAVRLAVPPFDAATQAQYSAFVQETLAIQYEAATAIDACEAPEELAGLLADLRAIYGDSLGV